jgi:hypothetical protein
LRFDLDDEEDVVGEEVEEDVVGVEEVMEDEELEGAVRDIGADGVEDEELEDEDGTEDEELEAEERIEDEELEGAVRDIGVDGVGVEDEELEGEDGTEDEELEDIVGEEFEEDVVVVGGVEEDFLGRPRGRFAGGWSIPDVSRENKRASSERKCSFSSSLFPSVPFPSRKKRLRRRGIALPLLVVPSGLGSRTSS